jgi:hypothetical protein
MAERVQEIGREYVDKVCKLLKGTFGFHIFQVSYQAPDAVSVPVGTERIRFDILLFQERTDLTRNPNEMKVYFYCECKKRTNPTDLETQLKEFLVKALKAAPQIQRDFSEDFGFIFITNKPFGIIQENLEDVNYIHKFLGETYNVNDIARLCNRVGILFLSDWFLDTAAKGRLP